MHFFLGLSIWKWPVLWLNSQKSNSICLWFSFGRVSKELLIWCELHVCNVAGERLSASSGPIKKKGPHVPPPFPWSTEYRAKNHSLEWILRHGISNIRGEVQCKRCDGLTTVEVNLQVTNFMWLLINYMITYFWVVMTSEVTLPSNYVPASKDDKGEHI